MKNKTKHKVSVFSAVFGGTQFMACILSILLVFSSAVSSWAVGTQNLLSAGKRSLKIAHRPSVSFSSLHAMPTLPNGLPVTTHAAIERAILRPNFQVLTMSPYTANGMAVLMPKDLYPLSQAPVSLVQSYKRMQRLLEEDTPQAHAEMKNIIAQTLEQTQGYLSQVAALPEIAQSNYFPQIKEFLSLVKEMTRLERSAFQANLKELYQKMRLFYRDVWNDPQLQPALASLNARISQERRMLPPEKLFQNTKDSALQEFSILAELSGLVCMGLITLQQRRICVKEENRQRVDPMFTGIVLLVLIVLTLFFLCLGFVTTDEQLIKWLREN